jgi:hypothetical protein
MTVKKRISSSGVKKKASRRKKHKKNKDRKDSK